MERQKLRDLTAQANKAFRSTARSELLREAVVTAAKEMPAFAYPVEHRSTDAEYGNSELVLAIGDIHYGADIHVEGLNGETLNEFNHEVFEDRMQRLLKETIDIIERHGIVSVNLFFVGDLLDGMLRQSQLMRLEYGLVDSTMRLAEYLSGWIAELSRYANYVKVYSVTGNHSEIRPLKSKHREFEDENLERIILWYMEARLKDISNIRVHADCKRMKKVDVLGKAFLLLHGDGDQKIENISRDAVNLYGEHIDYFICGHLHRDETRLNGVTSSGNSMIIRTPSLCGMNEYAQQKGFGGRAGAVAMVVSTQENECCMYHLKVQ